MWDLKLTAAAMCLGVAFSSMALNGSAAAKCSNSEQALYANCLSACAAGIKPCKTKDANSKDACLIGFKACGIKCQEMHKGCLPVLTGCIPALK